jgi:GDPmannose 4,6-dehydratase
MADGMSLIKTIQEVQPDEIYNLAAMSHVKVSFELPEYTADANGVGTLRILEAVRILAARETRLKIYQASTSELLWQCSRARPKMSKLPLVLDLLMPLAKLYAYWITVNYREAYNIFASNGILFNHESPLRGETFIMRKISRGIASIVNGSNTPIYLGNLDAERDWGHAKDL